MESTISQGALIPLSGKWHLETTVQVGRPFIAIRHCQQTKLGNPSFSKETKEIMSYWCFLFKFKVTISSCYYFDFLCLLMLPTPFLCFLCLLGFGCIDPRPKLKWVQIYPPLPSSYIPLWALSTFEMYSRNKMDLRGCGENLPTQDQVKVIELLDSLTPTIPCKCSWPSQEITPGRDVSPGKSQAKVIKWKW